MIQQKAASFGLKRLLRRRAPGVLTPRVWLPGVHLVFSPEHATASRMLKFMHQYQASQRFSQLMPHSIGGNRTSWNLAVAEPCWVRSLTGIEVAGRGGANNIGDDI